MNGEKEILFRVYGVRWEFEGNFDGRYEFLGFCKLENSFLMP